VQYFFLVFVIVISMSFLYSYDDLGAGAKLNVNSEMR
jgi:hypothetical protein